MAGSFFDRHLVWWSSQESIEAGRISLLAVVEVIFSVTAYWWIAWYYDTYAHLLISAIVAPLVLLRSDASVMLGLNLFSRYWHAREFPLRSAKGVSLVIVSAVSAGGAGWLAAGWFLGGHEGWSLYWRSMLIGMFAINAGLGAAVAGTGLHSISAAIGATIAITGTATLAAAVAATAGVAGVGAGVGAGAITLAVWSGTIIVGAVAIGPGFCVGTLARAVAIRLFASLRHIHRGVAAVPQNWRHILFQIDLVYAPELVPGIGEVEHVFDFRAMTRRFFSKTNIEKKLFGALVVAILFMPSLLYRYSIKSTCWLYLPLIYVAHLPERLRDGEGRLIWVRALPSKIYEWIRLGLAVLTLGFAFIALISPAALYALMTAAGETPVTVFSLLFVLDFGDIRPWHYFTLPSAALTIVLFLWLDNIRKDEAAGATIDAGGWKISTAIYANRVRSMLVIIWIGFALYYFVEDAYSQCLLDDWMAPLLEWRFGPLPACPALSN